MLHWTYQPSCGAKHLAKITDLFRGDNLTNDKRVTRVKFGSRIFRASKSLAHLYHFRQDLTCIYTPAPLSVSVAQSQLLLKRPDAGGVVQAQGPVDKVRPPGLFEDVLDGGLGGVGPAALDGELKPRHGGEDGVGAVLSVAGEISIVNSKLGTFGIFELFQK